MSNIRFLKQSTKEKFILANSQDVNNFLCIKQSSLNFYVAVVSVFSFGGESIERVQSVDGEIFNCYEHARRHALSMLRKFGKFEGMEFKGSNI